MTAFLLPLADAAEEGKAVITWMLITGLVFLVVVVLGEVARIRRVRRGGH